MRVEILAVRSVAVVDVLRGDLLIDPALPNGFGEVDAVDCRQHPDAVVVVGVGTKALPFDTKCVVQVAEVILDDHGYGVRDVDYRMVGFRPPAPLFVGELVR